MNPFDKLKEAYAAILQWEADEKAGVAGTTDKPTARSASETLLYVETLLHEALLNRRNCDVGTAEEQWSRFEKMCFSNRQPDDPDYCSCKCKVDGGCVNDCALKWAQMPYEKGGAK